MIPSSPMKNVVGRPTSEVGAVGHGLGWIEKDEVADVGDVVGEGAGGFQALAIVDADERDLAGRFPMHFVEFRHLFNARFAPAGPKVEHDWAVDFREPVRLALKVKQAEIRRQRALDRRVAVALEIAELCLSLERFDLRV